MYHYITHLLNPNVLNHNVLNNILIKIVLLFLIDLLFKYTLVTTNKLSIMDSSYTTDSNIQLNNNSESSATGYDSDLPTDFESNYGSDYDEELAMINAKPKLSSRISNINLDNIKPLTTITKNTPNTHTKTKTTSTPTNNTKTKIVKRKRKTTTNNNTGVNDTNNTNVNDTNNTNINVTTNTGAVASVNNNDDIANDIANDITKDIESTASNAIINFELKAGLFTKEELELDPNKMVFIKYCKIKNDDLIKYYIKKHMPNMYKCSQKTCPIAKTNMWKRKLTYLILNRKNNINQDCRINNIELICPNCYCQEYGSQPFEKLKHAIGKRCLKCNYPIKTEFAATQNYCYVCNKTIKNISMNYNVSTSVNNKHVQYLNKIDNEFEEFMKTNAPCNPDYDLLNDRNSILIPSTDSETDIFTELGFDKATYMKALETRKHMQKLQQSYTNTNNTNNTTTTNKTTSSILPASIKYKKVNQMKSSRTLAPKSTPSTNNLLNDELNNIELNTDLDNTTLDDELNNI
jgi:hypothetical protein